MNSWWVDSAGQQGATYKAQQELRKMGSLGSVYSFTVYTPIHFEWQENYTKCGTYEICPGQFKWLRSIAESNLNMDVYE